MTADQKIVAVGSVSGTISMISLMAIIYSFWPVSPELTDVAAKLGYTARPHLRGAAPADRHHHRRKCPLLYRRH
jgi:hypothetical protein